MTTTLTGSNTFLLHQKLQQIERSFVAEHGEHERERIIVDEQTDFNQLHSQLETLPFLSARRLLVIEQPGRWPALTKNTESVLSAVADKVDVVLVEPQLDKRTAYARYLKQHTDYLEFKELDEPALIAWIVSTAKEAGGSISKADAQYLVRRLGLNQFMLYNELEKLLTYDAEVSRATIDLLTEPTPQSRIFALIDAVFSGNSTEAIRLYEDQRSQKVEPQMIFYMIARQLHIIALLVSAPLNISLDKIAQQSGVHPFALRNTQSVAKKLSKSELIPIVSELRKLDEQQKTSSINLDEALRNFIVLFARS